MRFDKNWHWGIKSYRETARLLYTCEFLLHLPQVFGFTVWSIWFFQMGTFCWFCTPPYVSLNFKIRRPWQIPAHHMLYFHHKITQCKPDPRLCSRSPIYKRFTADVIWLGKCFVCCVLASCVAAVSKVTLCFEWEKLYFSEAFDCSVLRLLSELIL